MWHHGWTAGFGGIGMMGFGLIFWLLLIGGIVVLVVWAVRTSSGRGAGVSGHEPDALEIARRRYARGDISKEQFEQLKQDLRH
ncbi:SHOCT domain-containing protein [candidate division WOR-3 bacterium]|nr:SHOCT domain-containing protein [candidate division WOR-3 bacterium]